MKIDVQWSDEDNCFIAVAVGYHHLTAHGATEAEAIKHCKDAVAEAKELHPHLDPEAG